MRETHGRGAPPHIGLQTVTWLHSGKVVHNDSLGYESVLRPGGVKLMTPGDGIAHAEKTPRDNSGRLNGVQLKGPSLERSEPHAICPSQSRQLFDDHDRCKVATTGEQQRY